LKLELSQLALNLGGSWQSDGPTVDQRFHGSACGTETLSFNSALDHLIIQNCWSLCEMKTDYQLTIQPEDPDGNIYFSVHSDSLGQLVGTAEPNVNCTQYLATFTNTSWDENFSLTHNAGWTQITVNETVFSRIPAPLSSSPDFSF
jgi:hypothetical protein